MNEYRFDQLLFFGDFTGNDGNPFPDVKVGRLPLEAIRNCPSALHFASAELKGDKAKWGNVKC